MKKVSDTLTKKFKTQYSNSMDLTENFDACKLIKNNIFSHSPLITVCSIRIAYSRKKGYNHTSNVNNYNFVNVQKRTINWLYY